MNFFEYVKRLREGNAIAQDGINLAKHDQRFHHGHYDPSFMSCSLRHRLAKMEEEGTRRHMAGGGADAEAEAKRQYDEVVSRFTNPDGTMKPGWMKAPNGRDTNLSERQWVQVRTPNFKLWFGDWEGFARLNPVSMDAAKDCVKGLMSRNAEFKTADGYILRFVAQSAKTYSKEAEKGSDNSKAHWCAVANIENLIRRAHLLYEEPPRNNSPDIAGYVKYGVIFTLGGSQYLAKITSKRYSQRESQNLYNVESVSVEKIAARGIHETIAKGQPLNASDANRISKVLDGCKRVSKIVDENGEPLVMWNGGWVGDEFIGNAWFTSDEEVAKQYGNGGASECFFISAPDALVIDAHGSRFDNVDGAGKSAEVIAVEADERDGVDTVVFRNIHDEFCGVRPAQTVVSHRNDQTRVKSATRNNGIFGESSSNIFH